jgi:hypothetical protein
MRFETSNCGLTNRPRQLPAAAVGFSDWPTTFDGPPSRACRSFSFRRSQCDAILTKEDWVRCVWTILDVNHSPGSFDLADMAPTESHRDH